MSDGSLWRSVGGMLHGAGLGRLGGMAMGQADDADRRARARAEENARWKRQLNTIHDGIDAGRQRADLFGVELPTGFERIDETQNLMLMGSWPTCSDKVHVTVPAVRLVSLEKAVADSAAPQGAHEAFRTLWLQALAGDVEAQFNLARQLAEGYEPGTPAPAWPPADWLNTAFRTPDLARSFFWYYRAGLQGNLDARAEAETLLPHVPNYQDLIRDPALMFPFTWRTVLDKFGQAIITRDFVLAADGELTGRFIDYGGAAGDQLKAMSGHPIGKLALDTFFGTRLTGRWRFEADTRMLHLAIVGHPPGAAPTAPEVERIQLIGAAPNGLYPAYFGKSEEQFTYTLAGVYEEQTS